MQTEDPTDSADTVEEGTENKHDANEAKAKQPCQRDTAVKCERAEHN